MRLAGASVALTPTLTPHLDDQALLGSYYSRTEGSIFARQSSTRAASTSVVHHK
jgi:hypothetical protein